MDRIEDQSTRGVEWEVTAEELPSAMHLQGRDFKPFVEQAAEFADWAERSGGFWIY